MYFSLFVRGVWLDRRTKGVVTALIGGGNWEWKGDENKGIVEAGTNVAMKLGEDTRWRMS